jgi:hypothetical protein
MTLIPHARLVLEDAKLVRKKLEDETDDTEWRLNWVLAVVLLRAVGDVLDKVDGAADPRVRRVAGELYRSWKEGESDAIFGGFIKLERDSIVHEYQTAMSDGSIRIAIIQDGREGDEAHGLSWLDENLYRPMEEGPFAGEDGRDLIDEALSWWHRQLDEVERRAAV